MKLEYELMANVIRDAVLVSPEMFEPDVAELSEKIAVKALSEIQVVLQNDDISDFDAIEEIVCILEKYKISSTPRHDF